MGREYLFLQYTKLKKIICPQFNSDGPPKSEVSHFQKRLCPYYKLHCSQTDLITDLPMVWKFKFVSYGHNGKD